MLDVSEIANPKDGPLGTAYKALEHGAWDEAAGQFRAALAAQETAEAYEGLGLALWWLNDLEGAFDARERSYALFRAREDKRAAGQAAIWLAWDYLGVRGQMVVANGWFAASPQSP